MREGMKTLPYITTRCPHPAVEKVLISVLFCLEIEHIGIFAVLAHQFIVRADALDFTVVNNKNFISIFN